MIDSLILEKRRHLRDKKRNQRITRRQLNVESLEPRVVLSATYVVTDLGTLPDTDPSFAADINNSGEIVGTSSRTGLVPQSRAFRWLGSCGSPRRYGLRQLRHADDAVRSIVRDVRRTDSTNGSVEWKLPTRVGSS